MFLLSDSSLSLYARGPDRKPRKKRNFKGVLGNALVGAASGGAIADYGTSAIRPRMGGLKRGALGVGLIGGALAAGLNKYRNNNK